MSDFTLALMSNQMPRCKTRLTLLLQKNSSGSNACGDVAPTCFGRWGDHPMKLVPTYGRDVFFLSPNQPCQVSKDWSKHNTTRHRASTSTRLHFTFGAILSQQRNPCTNWKSA